MERPNMETKRTADKYQARSFWAQENLTYSRPNFRMRKCAALLNQMAGGRRCDLLDIGCGPASLRSLLDPNVHYFGLDIALQTRAPYLRELDFASNPIAFGRKRFDVVVALGVFEYMGSREQEKFLEIRRLLKNGGRFVMSYLNFGHLRRVVLPIYNNVQSIADITRSLETSFRIERRFPVSHHWRHKQPGRNALPRIQLQMNRSIPLISPRLAVEYFFVCSPR
jgi:SAM-dependent methyltransferase